MLYFESRSSDTSDLALADGGTKVLDGVTGDACELALEIEPGAEDVRAEQTGGVRLLDGAGEAAVGEVELAADVDEAVADVERVARDQHRLEQHVRVVLEDPAVLEGAGLAFVGVADDVFHGRRLRHEAPFQAGRKAGAAAPV